MSWNFILLIFINVCQCDESSLYSRINYVHSPDGELLWECPGIIKTMHTGFSVHMQLLNAPVLTRKKPDVMIWRGKICVSILQMLSVNENDWIIKGIVISFMFMDICNPSKKLLL